MFSARGYRQLYMPIHSRNGCPFHASSQRVSYPFPLSVLHLMFSANCYISSSTPAFRQSDKVQLSTLHKALVAVGHTSHL